MSKNTCKFSIFAFILTMILFVVFVFSTTAVFAAEGDAADAEALGETTNSFMNWLKSLDMDQVRVWIGVLITYLSANASVIVVLLVTYIKNKTKAIKQSAFYEELIAKMSEENQKKIDAVLEQINTKLDESAKVTQNYIKKQNSEKREIAKSNVEQMQKALSEVTVTLDSE